MDTGRLIVYLEFISLLIFTVIIILRYSERNRSQISLATVLSIWIVLFATRLIYVTLNPDEWSQVYADNATSLNFSMLVSGFVAFISLCAYPIYTIDPKLMRSKAAILTLVPLLLSIVSYVIYHKAMGIPENELYTFEAMWAARGTLTVMWRLVIAAIFIVTIIFSCMSIWAVIPSYESYIHKNYANPHYNIIWIRTFILGLFCISTVYFIQLFYNTLFTNIIYALVAGATFAVIADNAIMQRAAALPDEMSVGWSFRRGWYCEHTELDDDELCLAFASKFYRWIEEEKPYLATDFSISRVKDKFPELNYVSLDGILRQGGYTFQSYVRKCRVEESLRLMESDRDLSYKEIGYMVGFSHYSSFCRAFIAEKGVSPTHLK